MSDIATVGSLNTLSIDGIPYGVGADVDVGSKLSQYEKEDIPNSGKPMQKRTRIIRSRGPFKLHVTPDETVQIASQCDSTDYKKFVYVDASGTTWHTVGDFTMGEYMSADGSLEVTIQPLKDNTWQKVSA